MAKICNVTTYDNPYNPITEFDLWHKYDVHCGYGTCEVFATLCNYSPDLSDDELELEQENVVDRMVSMNPELYRKVVQTV